MASPRITCGPMQLRLITPRSAHQLFQLARDPELSRYLSWRPHRSLDDSLAHIDDTHRLWRRRIAFLPGVFDVAERSLVGSIGVSGIDRANHRAEVGTWIGIPHRGRGYNLHAKAAIFAFCFEVLALRRVELLVRCDNERSLVAAAQLPGVLDEGIQHMRIARDGESHDARMFAITRASYDPSAYPSVVIDGALA